MVFLLTCSLVHTSAEGPDFVGSLFERDPPTPSTHHDHDENGTLSSGKIDVIICWEVNEYPLSHSFCQEILQIH
jgi:hypothetical protein